MAQYVLFYFFILELNNELWRPRMSSLKSFVCLRGLGTGGAMMGNGLGKGVNAGSGGELRILVSHFGMLTTRF
jgi:hypothetical protein